MKVFVAGATGVIGRRAVAALVEAGHEVTAVARSEAKAGLVRSLGARPVTVDLFDAGAVTAAVAGHEVVCNLATHIPPLAKAAMPGAWNENDRIRRQASRNLVDAALAAGAERYVQESVSFVYADAGDRWIDETSALDMPPWVASIAEAEAQAQRFTAAGGIGVVLRFGQFYAPDSSHTVDLVRAARNGVAAVIGAPDAYAPTIHADDAAAAVVAAIRAPAGTYNVVDDEPVTRAELISVVAAAVGRRRLSAPPTAAVRTASRKSELLARSQRVSNRLLREATGWAPVYPSVREGLPAVVAAMGEDASWYRGPLVRLALVALAVSAAVVGVWAQLWPRSFYESFPGGGRAWVAPDGPFNEHLVRDVGGLSLALVVLTLAAARTGTRTLVRTAAGAWLVYSIPHLAYHAGHLDLYDSVDQVANMVGLALPVVLAAVLLAHREPRSRGSLAAVGADGARPQSAGSR